MNTFKDDILQKIAHGDVRMVPRWHFVLKATLLGIGAVLAALISIYLLSFLLFVLNATGLLFAPSLGMHGAIFFITSSPWIIIGTLGMFWMLLYVLVTRYSFSYKRPFMYSVIAVVLFVVAFSSLIQQTAVHERVHSFVEDRNVPGIGSMYRTLDRQPDKITVGTITRIDQDTFVITTGQNNRFTIVRTEGTSEYPVGVRYSMNKCVLVLGKRNGSTITAIGIRQDERICERQLHMKPHTIPAQKPPLR